ncbi:MAG TPA: efflux transporter outer membrane subunit [Gemmatimonadales bacterium]|nr:efflux transporter outer membrane subunit [Gemmatimonadales bacterium]
MGSWARVLAVLVLFGCASAPRYQPPPEAAPAVFREGPAMPESTAADTPWWRIYRDTTLQRLVRVALARSADLRIAVERVSEARALLMAARGAQLPVLGLSGTAQRNWVRQSVPSDGYTTTTRTDVLSAAATASWEADIFGVQRNAARSATASLQATEELRRGAALLVVAEVASAYVELQASDQQLGIVQRSITARRGYVDATKRRFDGTSQNELEYRQAQALLEAAREQAIDLEEGAADEENALSVLMGRAPEAIPRTGAPGDQLLTPVPAGLPSQLVVRRPDVMAAERALAAAGADVGAARAQLFPSLALFAGVRYSRYATPAQPSSFGILIPETISTSGTWYGTATVSQPLFAGGQIVAQVRAAEARRREALAEYEGTVLAALQDAENQLVAVRLAADRRESADSQVAYARAALPAAERRYEGGASPFLEVVDAQRTLLAAELGAVAARVRQAGAVIGLYKALGGGWQSDTPAAGGGAAN